MPRHPPRLAAVLLAALLLVVALASIGAGAADAADVALTGADRSTPSVTAEDAHRANDLAQAAYYTRQAEARGGDDGKAPWWGSLLLGAGLTLAGSIATMLLTDRVAARKARDDQLRLYRRHKLQVGLAVRAVIEALARFDLEDGPRVADFLSRDHLVAQPMQPRVFDRHAPYYLKYDLVSTIYRLCALLGWMELYRIDPAFMSGVPEERATFEAAFSRIRTILAEDSRSLEVDDPAAATIRAKASGDGVILADDQRAIGEKMLTAPDDSIARVVVGYATFAEALFRFPGREKPQQAPHEGEHPDLPQDHWIWNATSFIVGIGDSDGPDFRIVRLRSLQAELRRMMPSLLPTELQNGLARPSHTDRR